MKKSNHKQRNYSRFIKGVLIGTLCVCGVMLNNAQVKTEAAEKQSEATKVFSKKAETSTNFQYITFKNDLANAGENFNIDVTFTQADYEKVIAGGPGMNKPFIKKIPENKEKNQLPLIIEIRRVYNLYNDFLFEGYLLVSCQIDWEAYGVKPPEPEYPTWGYINRQGLNQLVVLDQADGKYTEDFNGLRLVGQSKDKKITTYGVTLHFEKLPQIIKSDADRVEVIDKTVTITPEDIKKAEELYNKYPDDYDKQQKILETYTYPNLQGWEIRLFSEFSSRNLLNESKNEYRVTVKSYHNGAPTYEYGEGVTGWAPSLWISDFESPKIQQSFNIFGENRLAFLTFLYNPKGSEGTGTSTTDSSTTDTTTSSSSSTTDSSTTTTTDSSTPPEVVKGYYAEGIVKITQEDINAALQTPGEDMPVSQVVKFKLDGKQTEAYAQLYLRNEKNSKNITVLLGVIDQEEKEVGTLQKIGTITAGTKSSYNAASIIEVGSNPVYKVKVGWEYDPASTGDSSSSSSSSSTSSTTTTTTTTTTTSKTTDSVGSYSSSSGVIKNGVTGNSSGGKSFPQTGEREDVWRTISLSIGTLMILSSGVWLFYKKQIKSLFISKK